MAHSRTASTPTWGRILPPLGLVLAILLVWQFLIANRVLSVGVDPKFLGSPAGVWRAFVLLCSHGYQGTPMSQEVTSTLERVVIGFSIGVSLAVPLGLIMGMSRTVGRTLSPIIGFLRPIPALAFVPLVVVWLGVGEAGRILVIATTAFLFGVLGPFEGVRSVQVAYLAIARNYNLTKPRIIVSVIFRAALPQIFSGVRTALTLSWGVVIAAELISAQSGLGQMVVSASNFFEVDQMYVAIGLIALLGLTMDQCLGLLRRRYVHWTRR